MRSLASTSAIPAASNSPRRSASGISSLSTVGTSTSTPSSAHRSSVTSANRGSSPRGSRTRRSGSTEYRPAAQGSMSAASSSKPLALLGEVAKHAVAGRPTRPGDQHPRGPVGLAVSSIGHDLPETPRPVRALDRLGEVRVADDLERLGVAAVGEPGPIARGRAEQLLVEVGADLDLGPVGADRLELALEERVDRDEARGPEVDRRRGSLVAEHPGHLPGRDQGRVVDVAVVLVDVARRVGVDRRRVRVSSITRLISLIVSAPSVTLHVRQRRVEETGRDQLGGSLGLERALPRPAPPCSPPVRVRIETSSPASRVTQEDAADADLDVVGVGADRQNPLAGPRRAPRVVASISSSTLAISAAGLQGLGHVVVGAGADRADRVVEARAARDDQGGDAGSAALALPMNSIPFASGSSMSATIRSQRRSGSSSRARFGAARPSSPGHRFEDLRRPPRRGSRRPRRAARSVAAVLAACDRSARVRSSAHLIPSRCSARRAYLRQAGNCLEGDRARGTPMHCPIR